MAVISIGSTKTTSFVDEQILPGAGPATFPDGVTGLGTVNYTTGSHSFTVNSGSVLHIADQGDNSLGMLAAFATAAGNSTWALQILGTVHALGTREGEANGVGISLNNGAATRASTVTVGADGSVYGSAIGLSSMTSMTLTNAGLIGGGDTGIYTDDNNGRSNLTLTAAGVAGTVSITNSATGEIFGAEFGIWNGSKSNLVVSNAGKISVTESRSADDGAVISEGKLTLTNARTGEITGNIFGNWLGSAVNNQGQIFGTITAEIDTDFIRDIEREPLKVDVNRNGSFNDRGDLTTDSASLVGMTVTNSGTIAGFQGLAFDGSLVRDILTNAASGIMYGDVQMGDGGDSLSNAGTIQSFSDDSVLGAINMGKGNDSFTNSASGRVLIDQGSELARSLDMGQGNDTATIAGIMGGRVDLGAGNDSLTLTGLIDGNLFADYLFESGDEIAPGDNQDGDDRITISSAGRVNGFVYLGAGNNLLNNSANLDGETLYIESESSEERDTNALVVALGGNDTLSNTKTGTINSGVNLGDGNNSITNAGRIYIGDDDDFPAISTGAGNDSLTNTGLIGAEDPMFLGNRSLSTNLYDEQGYMQLSVAVSMGAGNDLLVNTGAAATASSGIFGLIEMGAGNDTVRGGASTEMIYTQDDTGADQYLLGAGADAFFIGGADNSIDLYDGGTGLDLIAFSLDLSVNPGSIGHRIDLSAGKIAYFVDGYEDTRGSATTAIDDIRNVEQVVGSRGRDVIIGSAVGDSLAGGAGDDTIRGGLGRDVLNGGNGADVFLFESVTDSRGRVTLDSGINRATRDFIEDFSGIANRNGGPGEGDQIWLNFDSNTRAGTAGANDTNEFVFIGNNVGFTGTGGGYEGEFYAEVRTISQAGVTLIEVDTNGDRIADFSLALDGFHSLALADFYGSNVIGLP